MRQEGHLMRSPAPRPVSRPNDEAGSGPLFLESAVTPDGELHVATVSDPRDEGLLVPLAFAPLAVLVGVRPHRCPRPLRTGKGGVT